MVLNVTGTGTGTSIMPSTSSIITAQIQSIMLAQCCSKLIMIPMDWKPSSDPDASLAATRESPTSTFLHFWVLNPTIRYTTTTRIKQTHDKSADKLPINTNVAMKVFWKRVPASVANKLLDSDGVEEMILPQPTISDIEKNLTESASLLPRTGRTFQDWDVGLMDRWDALIAAANDKAVE